MDNRSTSKKKAIWHPNLFIAGAQKCGSTSLYHFLKEHPECHMSSPDSTHFFTKKSNLEDFENYRKYFDSADKELDRYSYIGEGTAHYLFHENVPSRMKEYLTPPLHFIFILRNPAERAVSAYWHMRKKYEDMRDIENVFSFPTNDPEEAIEIEMDRILQGVEEGTIDISRLEQKFDDPYWNFRYIRNGFYSTFIENYLNWFDRQQMCFVLTEQLRDSPEMVVKKIERFLGIDDTFVPESLQKKHNKTMVPKEGTFYWGLIKLQALANKSLGWIFGFSKPFESLTYREKPSLDPELLTSIFRLYRDEIPKLADVVDLDLEKYWSVS